jgi:indolepyruvate ferredoxin oxidoreductase
MVSTGGADLYLSGDILQGAGPAHLGKVRTDRTIAVVDRNVTPTSAMLQSDLAAPDTDTLQRAITERIGAGRVAFLDTKRIAEHVFDNHLLANVVLLGAAFQLGGLPLTLADIDSGMQRQGKSATENREAFEWGRWLVHDAAAVEASMAPVTDEGVGGKDLFDPSTPALDKAGRLLAGRALPAEVHGLLIRRAAQVVDYHDEARARRFLDLVERAAVRDEAAHEWALTRAVAESWFKLLTYKDEYEVARLHLKVDYDRVARDLGIEGAYSVTYHLHPPVLRRLGVKKKLPMGKPYQAAFHALRRMKRLRGTPLDVFGWDRDRRTERAVIEEYERLITDTVGQLSSSSYDLAVRIAESAMSIKGYGPIKEGAVARWGEQVASLRRSLGTAGTT